MTFLLSSLPAEVVGQILTGANVLQLWKCGDTVMNKKIALGVVRVRLEAITWMKCNFPPLIFELRSLRQLHISSTHELVAHPSEWPSIIKSLPQSLEDVYLNAPLTQFAFINFEGNQVKTTQYERGVSRFVDIGALLPRLRTLEFAHGDHVFELGDLAALPNTLTALRALATTEVAPSVSPLPSSLRRLSCNIACKPSIEFWSPLSNLESFEVRTWPGGTAAWLPRSLTHLRYEEGYKALLTWTQKLARSFPPHLKNLHLSRFDLHSFVDTNWIAELPRYLTSFSLDTSDTYSSFTIPVASLPRTLESLKVSHWLRTNLEATSFFELQGTSAEAKRANWPSSITSLSMPNSRFLV